MLPAGGFAEPFGIDKSSRPWRQILPQAKFPRQLHLHPAVTYVYVSSLGCKHSFLVLRAFSTLCQSVDFVNILNAPGVFPGAFCVEQRPASRWRGRSLFLAARSGRLGFWGGFCLQCCGEREACGRQGAARLDLPRTGETGRRPYRGSAAGRAASASGGIETARHREERITKGAPKGEVQGLLQCFLRRFDDDVALVAIADGLRG